MNVKDSGPTCLQCGQTRAAVKANNWHCAIVSYDGECQEDWPTHRWADWSDKALRSLGIKIEHFHKYRRTNVADFQFIDCAHTGSEHVFNTEGNDMLPPDYVCMRCWTDTREETP